MHEKFQITATGVYRKYCGEWKGRHFHDRKIFQGMFLTLAALVFSKTEQFQDGQQGENYSLG